MKKEKHMTHFNWIVAIVIIRFVLMFFITNSANYNSNIPLQQLNMLMNGVGILILLTILYDWMDTVELGLKEVKKVLKDKDDKII